MISGWAANEIAELNRNKLVELPKELTRLVSLAQFRDLTSEELQGDRRSTGYDLVSRGV